METQKQLMDAMARSAPLVEVQRLLYTFHVLEKEGGNKVHAAERPSASTGGQSSGEGRRMPRVR